MSLVVNNAISLSASTICSKSLLGLRASEWFTARGAISAPFERVTSALHTSIFTVSTDRNNVNAHTCWGLPVHSCITNNWTKLNSTLTLTGKSRLYWSVLLVCVKDKADRLNYPGPWLPSSALYWPPLSSESRLANVGSAVVQLSGCRRIFSMGGPRLLQRRWHSRSTVPLQ